MAPRADLCVWLVIDHVFVAAHAGGAVVAYALVMYSVACGAVGMTLADRHVGQAVKTRELGDFVAPGAARLWQDLASVRLVTREALAMPLRALGHLLFVAATAGREAPGLVRGALVTPHAARMSEIPAG